MSCQPRNDGITAGRWVSHGDCGGKQSATPLGERAERLGLSCPQAPSPPAPHKHSQILETGVTGVRNKTGKLVAQTSKSAVSRVSQPAWRSTRWRVRYSSGRPIWKSAIQQVGPAERDALRRLSMRARCTGRGGCSQTGWFMPMSSTALALSSVCTKISIICAVPDKPPVTSVKGGI